MAKSKPIGQCKLCLQTKELRDSHLMPASLYKKTKWEGTKNNNTMVVSARGAIQISLQVQDYVLCHDCEQLFSAKGERYVMRLVTDRKGKFPLLEQIRAAKPTKDSGVFQWFDQAALPTVDRTSIAYFALSVFWRASAHKWRVPGEESPQIRLGPYQEPRRTFLLGETAFPDDLMLMFVVCTDRPSQNSFYAPTRSGKNENTTHMLQARGLSFLMTTGKKITDVMKSSCLVGGKDQWILVRSCEDKVAIALNSFSKEAALRRPL
jgi:hypothetical protein